MIDENKLKELASSDILDTYSELNDESTHFIEGDIKEIAVIGFGPCGAAAVYQLINEKNIYGNNVYKRVIAYERRKTAGGLWNYSSATKDELSFDGYIESATSKDELQLEDPPIMINGEKEYISSMYDDLYTNVPVSIMPYHKVRFEKKNRIFADRKEVLNLINKYSEPLNQYVHFNTNVLDVDKEYGSISKLNKGKWRITYVINGMENDIQYDWVDSVIIACGNYDLPYIPKCKGINDFSKNHIVTHSKYYRKAEKFKNQTVMVIGGGASGLDIALQIRQHAKKVYNSIRFKESEINKSVDGIEQVDEIIEYDSKSGSFITKTGLLLRDIDSIVYCTGFLKSFPMLNNYLKSAENPLIKDGKRVMNVYKQLISIYEPTLGIIGLPKRVVPLRMAEVQSAYLSRFWSGKLKLCSQKEMIEEDKNILEGIKNQKLSESTYHDLEYPKDVDFSDSLLKVVVLSDIKYFQDSFNKPSINHNSPYLPEFWNQNQRLVRANMSVLKQDFMKSLYYK